MERRANSCGCASRKGSCEPVITHPHATYSPSMQFVSLNDLLVAPAYVDMLAAAGLDSLEALFDPTRGESLDKPGLDPWRERVRLSLDASGGRGMLYLKRYRDPPASARREVIRSETGAATVAEVEWSWLNRLRDSGFPCPEPVALGGKHENGRELRSALVTAAVPGVSLEHWVLRQRHAPGATREVLVALAELIRRFHAEGTVHRDLYLSHVLYDESASPAQSLYLIDLQRLLRPRARWRRWIVKDLAALNYSTPATAASSVDRIRWLKVYLGVSRLDADARRLVYRVVGKTQSIERHDRRRRLRLGEGVRRCEP